MLRTAARALWSCAALLASCAAPATRTPAIETDAAAHDVVVYGGTAAGVICAVSLAREGRDVLLIEPTDRIGGMTTCGLGATDVGNKEVIGGIAREFYQRLRTHYSDDAHWTHQAREAFAGRGHDPGGDAVWTFEPSVALAVLTDMLAETEATVWRGAALDLDRGVEMAAGRIRTIRLVDGRTITARIFVDASYEGDLLSRSGVSYTVGREANASYGETLDGVQHGNATKHQFTNAVDPYIIPGEPASGLLRWVTADTGEADGSADHRVQAYCLRLCTTDVAANRLPWTRPANYAEHDYELLLRNFDAGDRRVPWNRVAMPNRKTDTNNNFAISTDAIGLSYGWPDADHATRAQLYREHLEYTQGLMWTLATHPRVPPAVRAEFQTWGRARDEFTATDGWPPQLYVREARRMVADVVISERHCRGFESVEDPVGMGSYGMDSHNVQRFVDADGHARNEGDVQVHGFPPYGISYRAIVPSRDECTNLLVPVCVSATHIAFGSIRMEPVFMVLAHSAAIAADQALRGDCAVQDLPYDELRLALLAAGQVLERQAPPRGTGAR